jgi:hypothetical protein
MLLDLHYSESELSHGISKNMNKTIGSNFDDYTSNQKHY